MRRGAVILLAGCAVENTLDDGKRDPFDSGPPDVEDSVPAEECNGVDDNGDGLYNNDDTPLIVVSPFTGGPTDLLLAIGLDGATALSVPDVLSWGGPAVADIDADGVPEVVFDAGVYDGATGEVEATLDEAGQPRSPVLADLDQDGAMEILLGHGAYAPDGTLLWSSPGGADGAFAATVDADGDAGGEVLVVSGDVANLHDQDGTLLRTWSLPGVGDPGPPCVADLDADGAPELVVARGSALTAFELDGSPVWSVAADDPSGSSGCSAYDLDGYGAAEVLYADESSFRIADGRTGATRYGDTTHTSGTAIDYPVVADLDDDGSPEIVVAESDSDGSGLHGFVVYGAAGASGWARAGETWTLHDFGTTNAPADGSIPSAPIASWQAYNQLRACPTLGLPGAPDLAAAVTDSCIADCVYGPVALSLSVWNEGTADAPAGAEVALYVEGARVASLVLPEVPAGAGLDGIEVELEPAAGRGVTVRVDDGGAVTECDEGDNEVEWAGDCD